MSSLDLDIDIHMNSLELEWRAAFDESVLARAYYESLLVNGDGGEALGESIERMRRAETAKARVMAKIERLEESLQDVL